MPEDMLSKAKEVMGNVDNDGFMYGGRFTWYGKNFTTYTEQVSKSISKKYQREAEEG